MEVGISIYWGEFSRCLGEQRFLLRKYYASPFVFDQHNIAVLISVKEKSKHVMNEWSKKELKMNHHLFMDNLGMFGRKKDRSD